MIFEPWMAFVLGLLVGSFLNVCIHRLPRELSVWSPSRSFCPQCGAPIAWYDNVPVLSYLMLRGKCRKCGAPISWRYPAVELLTAILFAVVAVYRLPAGHTVKLLVFMAIMVTLIFSDLEERFLPDAFTLGGALIGFVLSWFAPFGQGVFLFLLEGRLGPQGASVAESVGSAFLLGGAFWVFGEIYYLIRKREGLGLGDVKMMATLGAFLGLQGAMLALVAASLGGCILGIGYMIANKKDFSTYELPLGTFLGLAGIGLTFYLLPTIVPQ